MYGLSTHTDQDGGVWCRITWTPNDGGVARTVEGDYLYAGDYDYPKLSSSGLSRAADHLGLPKPFGEYAREITARVERKLAVQPSALLYCATGRLFIQMTYPPSSYV